MSNDPRFPIGKFHFDGTMTEQHKAQRFDDIEQTPARLRAAVRGLNDHQLDTPYREGGWTVRQVVHHVPDSHMNSYVRFKLALTEDEPTICPYMENLWAELPEARSAPIELSLSLLESLHKRWILVLRGIKPADWKRIMLLGRDKDDCRARAIELFPTLLSQLQMKKHHNRAEAILLAEYGRRL